jgi:hypothetical protein
VSGHHEDLIRGRVDELGRMLTIILAGVAYTDKEELWPAKTAASELLEQRI